jgi:hypothetical protein
VDGDASSYAIACASIIAKVTRDRLMTRLAARYPGYGWEHNAGYTTRAHVAGLHELGLTPHHRRTYARIRGILEGDQLAFQLLEDDGEGDGEGEGEDEDGPRAVDGPDAYIAIPIDEGDRDPSVLEEGEYALVGA